MAPKIKVHCFPATRSPACFFYRIYNPLSVLSERFGNILCTVSSQPTEEMVSDAEIVIFQRAGFPQDLDLLHKLLSLGKKIIYETDDNLLNLPPSNPHYKHYSDEIKSAVRTFISKSHAVTVTTTPLKEALISLHENIFVIPNSLDFRIIPPRPHNNMKLVVGYQGGYEHEYEMHLISRLVKVLTSKEFRDKVLLKVFGFKLDGGAYHIGYFPFEHFYKALSLADFDIGLAPALKNNFNDCKSNLKWLEYSALKTATVASEIFPYSTSIEPGVTGFLARSKQDWVDIVVTLVRDRDLLSKVQNTSHDVVVSNYNVFNICEKWNDVFNYVLSL